MCRLVAYIGRKRILLSELLDKPINSLIQQSHNARSGTHGVNADGFGLAWYDQEIDNFPGVFKSTRPAWNDSNLRHIAAKTASNCFLGHIRASTVGEVALNNCHPFHYKQYTLVHNGTIRNFHLMRRSLIAQLDDEIFEQLKAQTDSEHIFCLIMQYLKNSPEQGLSAAVEMAFKWIHEFQMQYDNQSFSRLNIVITDGYEIVATRFSNKKKDSLSLYYVAGSSEVLEDNQDHDTTSVVIASEPLTDYTSHWQEVSHNSYINVRMGDKLVEQHRFDFCE